jgi:translation initiation factor IF-2
MAGEFGITTEEVIDLLRKMDVPVRSHLTLLTDDQVSRIRARWEREKRARAERAAQAAAPAPAPRRRRSAAEPAAAAAAPAAEATPATTVRRRVRSADAMDDGAGVLTADDAHAHVEDAPTPVAPIADEPRTPAPVAATAVPAPAAPVAAAPAAPPTPPAPPAPPVAETPVAAPAPVEPPKPAAPAVVEPAPVREVAAEAPAAPAPAAPIAPRAPETPGDAPIARPAAPVADAPPAPVRPAAPPAPAQPTPARPQPAVPSAMRPVASASPSGQAAAPPAPPAGGAPAAPGGPRPRPITPGAPRAGAARPGAPRGMTPVASAAPGGASSRRDGGRGPVGGFASPYGGGGGGGGGAGAGTGTAGAGAGAGARGRGGKKGKRGAVDQQAVADNISRTLQGMRGAPGRGGRGRDARDSREELEALRAANEQRERTTVRVNEFITVADLAQILKISPTQIVGFALKNLGLMVTINQRLDFDQIELIASEFGFQAVREEEYLADFGEETTEDAAEDLIARPPVVTIMGHVDHGKTSLLDYIRKANVVAGEAGGITQHIGAYHVSLPGDRQITFLDTPGHQAFTAMRARGAQVTDIVVLVVAADDGLMPQTIEAISHAKNAGVPLVVAINKIDLPQANPGKVKQELLQHNVVLEEFGGNVLSTEISAKKGTNVGDLLDQLVLQAEILDLKANADKRATGTVVEAQLDPGKGPVATVLVQSGTLKVGDDFIVGQYAGRVRALLDERGKQVKQAGPAIPVQILGLTGVPMAGDQLIVVEDATQARDIAQRRERLDREAKSRRTSKGAVTLEDFMNVASAGEKRTLKLLIKADQGGPAEALADALGQLSNEEVVVDIIQRGVGAITEGDILLAKAAGAIIIGFHVRPDTKARTAAEREGVDIKLYRIIYEAVNDVKAALEGMLKPEQREVILGEAEVREVFKVPRIGAIAGSYVRSGTFQRGAKVRVVRDGVEIYDGNLGSLRRFKDDVKEVKEGFECGIGVENFNDLKVGDVIECYRTEEVARTLVSSQS